MLELVVATKNKKKLEELKEILKGNDLKITSLADYGKTPRITENGRTFKANAIKKAQIISRFTGKLTLGEDSGLVVDALKGKPGVFSSRFAGKNKSDNQNNLKVLKLLGKLPFAKRKAHYTCAVALAHKNNLIAIVEGKCSGFIGFVRKGSFGFGYDPLFVIPKYKKTFAQLGAGVKHKISHRAKAMQKIRKIISRYLLKYPANY